MPITLRDLTGRGVVVAPHEAVAIAQQLVVAPLGNSTATEPGPPSLDTVVLHADGSVACESCESTPAVFEIAILLEAMLPRDGGIRVPGGLRYALARALMEVDAPPFESIGDFSKALARFERGDRASVLRAVYARAGASEVGARPVERRRAGPTVDTLRRDLRAADEALFRQLQAPAPATHRPPSARSPRAGSGRVRRRTSAAATAIVASFAAGYAAVHELGHRPGPVHDHARQRRVLDARVLPPTILALVAPAPDGLTRVDDRDLLPASRDIPRVETLPAVTSTLNVERLDSPASSAEQTPDFGNNGLELVSVTDGNARSYNARTSPDGTLVAFDSDRSGERAVYVAARSGGDVRRVTADGPAALPTWSPDGRTLAYLRAEGDRPHVWNLWSTDLQTGNSRRLTSYRLGETGAAAWFPDGRRVCYTHHDTIVLQDLATGATREYASPVAGRPVRHPAVSPDGSYVLVQVAGSGGWLLELSDGSMRRVLTDPTVEAFAWSADGGRVAYHSRRDDRWGVWVTGLPPKG